MDCDDSLRWGFQNIIVSKLEKIMPWIKPTIIKTEINKNIKKLLYHISFITLIFFLFYMICLFVADFKQVWIFPFIELLWIFALYLPITFYMLRNIEHKTKMFNNLLLVYCFKFFLGVMMIGAACSKKEKIYIVMVGVYIFFVALWCIILGLFLVLYVEGKYLEKEKYEHINDTIENNDTKDIERTYVSVDVENT